MINWDYMITYGGPELFVPFVVIVITPIVYWLILRRFNWIVKIIGILSIWVGAIYIAYWDVYQIAKEAERLCREEAGLHVYETVEAEGFLGFATNIEYWSEYGFKYVEGLYGNKKTRLMIENGEIVRKTVTEYISDYQFVTDSKMLEMPIVRYKDVIMNRKTGEILGEVVAFKIYPAWLDSYLLAIIPATWTPPRCDQDYRPEPGKRTIYLRDLIKAVIVPIQLVKGDGS